MTRLAIFVAIAGILTWANTRMEEAPRSTVADRALIPILQRSDDALKSFSIVERHRVNDELDLCWHWARR